MKFCWHDWSQWRDIEWFEKLSPCSNRMIGYALLQQRFCLKCHKKKMRMVHHSS